jgi:hypothetical protein
MINSKGSKLKAPVLYIVFNRLDTVKQTFIEIQKARPSKFFIAADGPRNLAEKKKTEEVRDYILKNINWKCQVKTLFRDKNLGCKFAVSGALTWFFKNVKMGIILEDDCLPTQSFFRFCSEMLEKYKNNNVISQISGTNVERKSKIEESYLFSRCFGIWGWATWARAWKDYDIQMKKWPKTRKLTYLKLRGYSFLDRLRHLRLYELAYKNKVDTWDSQWDYACKSKDKLCIIPKKNLISNIGFKGEATHTAGQGVWRSLKNYDLEFPLNHSKKTLPSRRYLKSYNRFYGRGVLSKLKGYIIWKLSRK